MTRHGPALLALAVLAIASWTYNVNYDTRAALDRLNTLRAEIAGERENLQVLRVEWAYLNAPDRLARLVAEQNERLALVGLTTDALGYVAAVPYPRGLPARPAPARELEGLIAAAPAPAAPAMPEGQEPVTIALADAAAHPESAGMLTSGAAGAAAGDGGDAGSGAVAAAEKAEALGAEAAPLTMEQAVAMALAEVGVLDEKLAAPAIVPAMAGGGTPMPRARPAVWAGR